ncbi:MAG: hypothetical protein ABIW47_01940 [Ginsengibacter sp.]|jgi:hypothetical protein
MYLSDNYITKEKFTAVAGWLITALVLSLGYKYIEGIIAFVLEKMYEFFIQNATLKIG